MTKLSTDCRWATRPAVLGLLTMRAYDWVCHHPTSLRPAPPDYVTGETPEPRPDLCVNMRGDPKCCGPEGRFREPIGFGP
jgi:hypothetical protein